MPRPGSDVDALDPRPDTGEDFAGDRPGLLRDPFDGGVRAEDLHPCPGPVQTWTRSTLGPRPVRIS